MTTAIRRIDESRIPEILAEDLEEMTPDQLEAELSDLRRLIPLLERAGAWRDAEDCDKRAREIESELIMRRTAPGTSAMCHLYGVPSPIEYFALGMGLCALPRKEA